MNTYTNIFGGQNINPADLSYKAYALTEDIHLQWPFEALDGARVVADKIDISALDGTRSVFMPDATLVSVGEDVLFNNVGAFQITIRDFNGGVILVIAPAQQWYIYLTDNEFPTPGPAGVWQTTHFGSGTTSASASALAGAGLRAAVNKLDQNLLTRNDLSVGDQNIGANNRAEVFRNVGGLAVYHIAAAASLAPPPNPTSNGWFFTAINSGSGDVQLTPVVGELIDNSAVKTLAPGESCVVYCFGTGFATMGHGRAISSDITALNIDIAGPPPANNIILTGPQVAAQIQNFTGTLSANRIVDYGSVKGYWFVWNDTNGPFSTTFRTSGTDTGVVVTQHNFSVLRSDGANMEIAFSDAGGTVTSIATVPGEITGGEPSPITTTGTIGLASITPPVAGTYGEAGKVPVLQVDTKGRVVAGSELDIAIAFDKVGPFSSLELLTHLTNETGAGINVPSTALAVFNEGPTINSPILLGVPTTPYPLPANISDSTIANTQFVMEAVASALATVPATFRGYLFGLTLSTAGSSAIFGVAAGVAVNSTNAVAMTLASAYTKTTGAWVVGTGLGGLDTGVIANSTWYHIFLIRRPDTGVVDVLVSLSATAPALPGSYTQFRRIGSIQTNASAQWIGFVQKGDDFYRAMIQDVASAGIALPMALRTLSVPTGVVVEPFTTANAVSGLNVATVIEYAPAANLSLSFVACSHYEGDSLNGSNGWNSIIGPPTNLLGQFGIGIPVVIPTGGMTVSTFGWRDTRGRDD